MMHMTMKWAVLCAFCLDLHAAARHLHAVRVITDISVHGCATYPCIYQTGSRGLEPNFRQPVS